MAKDPESFEELIDAIADGVAVDWPRLKAAGRIPPQQQKAAKAIAGLSDSTVHFAAGSDRGGFDPLPESAAPRPAKRSWRTWLARLARFGKP